MLHGDLKSRNVLLRDEESGLAIKITDYNVTRGSTDSSKATQTGTWPWMAPEVMNGPEFTSKCDVYSFAIVMWEILSGLQLL